MKIYKEVTKKMDKDGVSPVVSLNEVIRMADKCDCDCDEMNGFKICGACQIVHNLKKVALSGRDEQ